jgi:hypothetical protein
LRASRRARLRPSVHQLASGGDNDDDDDQVDDEVDDAARTEANADGSGSAGAMLEPTAVNNKTGLVAWSGVGSCGFYVVDALNCTHMRLTWTRNNDSAVLDDTWVVRNRQVFKEARSTSAPA